MPSQDKANENEQPAQTSELPKPTTLQQLSLNPEVPPIVTPTKVRKPKISIVGFILSIIALLLSGIGWGLVHAQFTPTGSPSSSETANKISTKTAEVSGHIVASLIAMPILVVGFTLSVIAVLLALICLRNGIRVKNAIFSTITILLSGWAIYLVISAFAVLKAH